MRTRKWIWLMVLIALLTCWLVPVLGAQERLTPEQIQQKVVERAREIERREAEEKRADELAKQDTPAMRKARRELQKEANEAKKSRKNEINALHTANIQGCDPGVVSLNPRIGSDWRLRQSYLYSTVVVTIVNRSSEPIDITSNLHGALVRSLCSGGTVTLFFSPRPSDPSSVQFMLTAISKSQDGVKADTQSINLYRGYGSSSYHSRQLQSQLWEVNPH